MQIRTDWIRFRPLFFVVLFGGAMMFYGCDTLSPNAGDSGPSANGPSPGQAQTNHGGSHGGSHGSTPVSSGQEAGVISAQESALRSLQSEGKAVSELPPSQIDAIGQTAVDFDGDGNLDAPLLLNSTTLGVIDRTDASARTVDLSSMPAKTSKTLLGAGQFGSNSKAVFYVGQEGNKIVRVRPDGSPTVVANPENGAGAVAGIGDIDGDGSDDLVFTDGSQQTRYVEQGDNVTQTFTKIPNGGVGSNNGVGIGPPADVDGDGTASVPVVDGSNQIRLLGPDGVRKTLISGNDDEQAAKSPVAPTDVDGDDALEVVYLENNNSPSELKYVDVGSATPFKALHGANDGRIQADPERGVAAGAVGWNVIKVTPTHHHHGGEDEHHFELSTHEVPSGWTTFRFDNSEAHATHFAYLAKVPDDVTAEDYRQQVTEPFQPVLDSLAIGDDNPFEPVFGPDGLPNTEDDGVPSWYWGVTFKGGVGLTAAGQTSQTTVHLKSGNYIMECYVKTEDNRFHSYHGMLEDFEVTSEPSGAPEPHSSVEVALSTQNGLELQGDVSSGRQTFKVSFENQGNYGGFGHDVHLIRLEDGTTVQSVDQWMNWMSPVGLVSSHDSPGPATFLGGMHDIFPLLPNEKSTAYFAAHLESGEEYALLSEVPPLIEAGVAGPNALQKTFTVP